MENSLVQESFGALSSEHGSPVGIVLQADLPFEDWKDRCASVGKVKSFGPFGVGDVFRYGMELYGEKRALAAEPIRLADYTPAFVRKCAEICTAIPFERRRVGLSFEHHAACAKIKSPGCASHQGASEAGCEPCVTARLDEISAWLQKAEQKKWTAAELKDQLKAARTTTVREHERALPGQDFDPQTVRDAVGVLKHQMMEVRENTSGLLNAKGKLDKGKSKTMLTKLEQLDTATSDLREILEGEIGGKNDG
jgi:hypothetical protein